MGMINKMRNHPIEYYAIIVKGEMGAGKMAQSVKSLLYKHQERGLGPQQHCKNLYTVADMGSTSAGEADRFPWLADQSDQLLTQVHMHYLSVTK